MTQAEAFDIVRVDRLQCTFEPRPWHFANNRAEDIDTNWARLTRANPKLYNGRVLLQHHGQFDGKGGRRTFRGAYLEAEFKAFLAWRDFGFPDTGVRNCFALAALSTADGAFIVGEMAAHTASPGRVYFPAGTPDPQDVRRNKVDLRGSALRELTEETGVSAKDVTAALGWTLLVGTHRIACMRTFRSEEDAVPLAARIHRFLARQAEAELARVHVIRSEADCRGLDMPTFMRVYFQAVFAKPPRATR